METAFFARNPVWGCYDRGNCPGDFEGPVEGVNPSTGKIEGFVYGVPFEAPYESSDDELEALELI